jgi:peptide/nickel transport system permease protein
MMHLRQNAQFWAGFVIVALVVAVALSAHWLSPHDYAAQDLRSAMKPPAWLEGGDWTYPLGTDRLGRDVMSRLMHGARVSTAVGVISVLLGGVIGTGMGLLAGYFRGWVDRAVSRLIDIQLSFPPVFLAIAIMAAIGQNLANMIVVLALVSWVQYARVCRGSALAVREQEFVLAARTIGARNRAILLRHLLPSVLPPLAVIATINMSSMILAEAALSFLGMGVQPPTPAWGSMISEARAVMSVAPWNAIFPGLSIVLFVTGANLMGEGLRLRQR